MTRTPISHQAAVGLLSDFVTDGLDHSAEVALRDHIESCEECRQWVETYRLLQEAFGSEDHPDLDQHHPRSELLALCVGRPEEVFEVDRSDLREHLERCSSCKTQIEILREAVLRARPTRAEHRFKTRPPLRVGSWNRWGRLAAGLGLLAVGLAAGYFALVTAPGSSSEQSQDLKASSFLGEETGVLGPEAPEELVDVEIGDTRLIEAEKSLLVTNVKVNPGARVTFRVGEVAAFGDGFQISDGGAIVVEAGKPRRRARGRGVALN